MDSDLLIQGGELMLLGMGIVFGFLTALVFTVRGMSWLANRLDDSPPPMVQTSPIDVADNRQLIAVISAAVSRYRVSRAA